MRAIRTTQLTGVNGLASPFARSRSMRSGSGSGVVRSYDRAFFVEYAINRRNSLLCESRLTGGPLEEPYDYSNQFRSVLEASSSSHGHSHRPFHWHRNSQRIRWLITRCSAGLLGKYGRDSAHHWQQGSTAGRIRITMVESFGTFESPIYGGWPGLAQPFELTRVPGAPVRVRSLDANLGGG